MRLYRRLVVVVMAWGALAFGAVYSWAYWPLAAALVALGVWGLASAGRPVQLHARALAAGLLVVGCAIAVQIIPLPYAWFARISPGADRLLTQYTLGYAFDRPPWHPLSISPADTVVALALLIALAVFLVGMSQTLRDLNLDRLMMGLVALGVLLALVGIVQQPFEAENHPLVYGFWAPQNAGGGPFGPFINKNHFAGWMLMLLPLAAGYCFGLIASVRRRDRHAWRRQLAWLAEPEASRIALVGFAVLAMGTALALTRSRSGVAALAVAILALAGFAVRQTRRLRGRAFSLVGLMGVLAGAIAWAGVGPVAARFSATSADLSGRLAAWHDALRIVRDFPAVGTGLGTFERAMLIYQTGDRQLIFAQAHNDYLQLAAEGGMLVTLPAAVAVVILGAAIWRRFAAGDDPPLTRWTRAGAVAGLAAIATQSFVDFSLQVPGNTALFALLAAIAVHVPSRRPANADRL